MQGQTTLKTYTIMWILDFENSKELFIPNIFFEENMFINPVSFSNNLELVYVRSKYDRIKNNVYGQILYTPNLITYDINENCGV